MVGLGLFDPSPTGEYKIRPYGHGGGDLTGAINDGSGQGGNSIGERSIMGNNNGKLFKLATRIFNRPLMIAPDKLDVILGVVGSRMGIDVSTLEPFDLPELPSENREPGPIPSGSIAVIPVHGTLVHRTTGLDAMSGLTSYESIRRDFREAAQDDSIDAILFDIDSPGGEVAGVFDLVDEIYASREIKPIYAFVNESALSAGYAIASAAEKVFLPRTGAAGSIGVIAVHTDWSKFEENMGVKYTAIYAGKHKNDFTPHEPLSDEAHKIAQEGVDSVYELFVNTAARNRSMKASDVQGTEARVYEGHEAVKTGLADAVMSWDEAVNALLSEHIFSNGGKSMNVKKLEKELNAFASDEAQRADMEEMLAGLGYVPASDEPPIDAEKLKAEAIEEGKKKGAAYALEIIDLCILSGLEGLNTPRTIIQNNTPVDEARSQIIEAKAAASGKDEISSIVDPLSSTEANPLIAEAEGRKKPGKEA